MLMAAAAADNDGCKPVVVLHPYGQEMGPQEKLGGCSDLTAQPQSGSCTCTDPESYCCVTLGRATRQWHAVTVWRVCGMKKKVIAGVERYNSALVFTFEGSRGSLIFLSWFSCLVQFKYQNDV